MKDRDEYATEFRALVERRLAEADTLTSFRCLWSDGRVGQAYMLWHEYKQEHKIVLRPDEDKVDEDFYWLHVR